MPVLSESVWPLCVAQSLPPGYSKNQELNQGYKEWDRNRGSWLNNRKVFPRMVMDQRAGTG